MGRRWTNRGRTPPVRRGPARRVSTNGAMRAWTDVGWAAARRSNIYLWDRGANIVLAIDDKSMPGAELSRRRT